METPKKLIPTQTIMGLVVLNLFLAAMLSGCVLPSGPAYAEVKAGGTITQPKDKGLVMVYSRDLPLGKHFYVWANDKLISSTMGLDMFFFFQADPGEVHIASTEAGGYVGEYGLAGLLIHKKEQVSFTVSPGEIYYVDMHNGFAREKMVLVSKAKGESKIKDCHWTGPAGELSQ